MAEEATQSKTCSGKKKHPKVGKSGAMMVLIVEFSPAKEML
jgi:hypothetical protein